MAKNSGSTRATNSKTASASRTSSPKKPTNNDGYTELSSDEYYSRLDKALIPIMEPIQDKIDSTWNIYSSQIESWVDEKLGKGTFAEIKRRADSDGATYDDFRDRLENAFRSKLAEKEQRRLKITIKGLPKYETLSGYSRTVDVDKFYETVKGKK